MESARPITHINQSVHCSTTKTIAIMNFIGIIFTKKTSSVTMRVDMNKTHWSISCNCFQDRVRHSVLTAYTQRQNIGIFYSRISFIDIIDSFAMINPGKVHITVFNNIAILKRDEFGEVMDRTL